MRVTFDSHVLGKVAYPERRKKDPDHPCLEKISAALQVGRIQGFICESSGALEAIQNAARPETMHLSTSLSRWITTAILALNLKTAVSRWHRRADQGFQ